MVRRFVNTLMTALICSLPLLAGALVIEVGDPAGNSEAISKHAVLVARTTACHSPEKTSLTATAEGVVDGQRRGIPLQLIPLSKPGTFAITHEWPSSGIWAVKIIARNPEYKDYATGALVAIDGNSVEWASVRHYFHKPTNAEVASVLDRRATAENDASLK